MVRYSDWCCQHCGEPLRTVPCLNCIQREKMENDDHDGSDGESARKGRATASTTR